MNEICEHGARCAPRNPFSTAGVSWLGTRGGGDAFKASPSRGWTPLARFKQALLELPPPGMGMGLHCNLLGVANRARSAGLHRTQAFVDIRNAIKPGSRLVSDQEIWDAIERAYDDTERRLLPHRTFAAPRVVSAPASPPPIDAAAQREAFIEQGRGWDEAAWLAASPVPVPEEPVQQTLTVLAMMFAPHEFVFIGDRYDAAQGSIRLAGEMVEAGASLRGPLVIANPLTGKQGLTKGGKPSWRCDACVADFRFAIAEFDNLDMCDQLAFWAGIGLPIAALVDSGGKSFHVWIPVGCRDAAAWQDCVGDYLYHRVLVPLGVDPACKNPARLTRLPGGLRDGGRHQRLLYLNPSAPTFVGP